MFDLSRDFPSSGPEIQLVNGVNGSKKRKRKEGKERASGAGGVIPDSELGMGMSRRMQRVIHEEVEEEEQLIADAMDVDSDSGSNVELSLLRRGGSGKGAGKKEGEYEAHPHEWHTFKYRPIMGIVLIGEGGEEEGVGPEVALVERPAWEAGLPGRWEGEQEWRDREVGL